MHPAKVWWFLRTQLTRWQYKSIGKRSYVAKPIYIQRRGIIIGDNVRIYPGMRAELTCQDAEIVFENNVSVGQNFHVVCYKGRLVIGKNTTISGNVFISNVDHSFAELNVHILEQEMLYKETVIGDNCFIGYGTTILPGTILGKQCIIGANSVVKGVFPDYTVVAGNPGEIIKKYSPSTGEWVRVRGLDSERK